ncbi:hypothetical protein LIER_13362 [Lithospermum erythrorhizon]|uniref:Uncharacterized protein n=1 Tax=Lithospermum erythrorhizon TaxID=34254 RepID=A0AAV3PV57_LITER
MILVVDIGDGSTEFVIGHQDLVSKVNEYNIEKVIVSFGTIRKIEKAVYEEYARDCGEDVRSLMSLKGVGVLTKKT